MNFTHLHAHSDYSLRDGIAKVKDIVQNCKEKGYPAACITDHGNVGAALKLYFECKEQNIKPIIGCELYVMNGNKRDHLVLLAKNKTGFHNLIDITSHGFKHSYDRGRPGTTYDYIFDHKEGLICLSACAAGVIASNLDKQNYSGARYHAEKLKEEFGADFYIELMLIKYERQYDINCRIVKVAQEHGIKTVITNDCHFIEEEDYDVHKLILLMANKNTLKDFEDDNKTTWANTYNSHGLHFKTIEELNNSLFDNNKKPLPFSLKIFEQSIENVGEVIDKIEEYDLDSSLKYPTVMDNKEKLLNIILDECLISLADIEKENDEEYINRLSYELKILKELNYLDYFWILKDIIDFAKKLAVHPIGAGRGSASGCLVSFLLGITEVDPIRWGLLFERFINTHRSDPPDIDTDFIPALRDKVKNYIFEQFPNTSIAIGTYGELKFRACLSDICRTVNIDYMETQRVTKKFHSDIDIMSWEKAIMIYPDFEKFAEKYKDLKIEKYFKTLFGSVRNISKHAAGIIISNKDISDDIALIKSGDELVTAWQEGGKHKELSKLGFMKFDILGLTAASIINDALVLIKQRHNIDIDLKNIDYDDEKAFDTCNDNNLCGIFQFDTIIGRGLIKSIQPSSVIELSNISALMRPGCLRINMDKKYIKRKADDDRYEIAEELNKVLGETYGIIIYQEQIIKICEIVGGFNLNEADDIRRIIIKFSKDTSKDINTMDETIKLKRKFIVNASKYLGELRASETWEEMVAFAEYGFNKSHSVSYAINSYRQLYLKTYYPLEFYCALMMNTDTNKERIKGKKEINTIIKEAISNGIKICNPDINKSSIIFSIIDDAIYFGLSNIKNIEKAALEIIKHRPYTDIQDFEDKVNKRLVNIRIREFLGYSGALDSIGYEDKLSLKEKAKKEKECLNVNLKYNLIIESVHPSIGEIKETSKCNFTILSVGTEFQDKRGGVMVFINVEEIDVSIAVWSDKWAVHGERIKKLKEGDNINAVIKITGDTFSFSKFCSNKK